ncbi:MAG: hypothetical protein HDQ88_01330 [Clostridia bacterium]|nr:hypothetical protein [Clostridia bacterium]
MAAEDGSGKQEKVWIYGKGNEFKANAAKEQERRVGVILSKDQKLQELLKDFPEASVEKKEEILRLVRGEADRISKITYTDPKDVLRQFTRTLQRDIDNRRAAIAEAGWGTQAKSLALGMSNVMDDIRMASASAPERIAIAKKGNAEREEFERNNMLADELQRREKEGKSNVGYMFQNPRSFLLKAGEVIPETAATMLAQIGGGILGGPVGFAGAGGAVGAITGGGEQMRRLVADPNLTDDQKVARADSAYRAGATWGGAVGAIPAGPSAAISRGLMNRQVKNLMAATPTLTKEAAAKQALQNAANAEAKRKLPERLVRAYPGLAADATAFGVTQQLGQNAIYGFVTDHPIDFSRGVTDQLVAGPLTAIPILPFAAKRPHAMLGTTQRRIKQEGIEAETPPEKTPDTTATATAKEAETPAAKTAPTSGPEYARSRFNTKGGYPNDRKKFVPAAIADIEAGKMTLADFEAAATQYAEQYKVDHPNAKREPSRYLDAQEAIKQYKEKHPDAPNVEAASTPEDSAAGATAPVGEYGGEGTPRADSADTSPDSTKATSTGEVAEPASDRVSEPTPRDGATTQKRGDDGSPAQNTGQTEADAGATLKQDAAAGEPVRDSGVEPAAAKPATAGEGNGGGESPASAGRPRAQDAATTGSGEHLNAAEVDKAAQQMEAKLAAGKGVVIDPATPKAAEAAPVETAPAKTKAKSSTETKAAAKRKPLKAEAVGEDGNVHIKEDEVADLPAADELAANDAAELSSSKAETSVSESTENKAKTKKEIKASSRKKVKDTTERPAVDKNDKTNLTAIHTDGAMSTVDALADRRGGTYLIGTSADAVFRNKGYALGRAVNEAKRALFKEAWTRKSNATAKKLHDLGVPKMELTDGQRATIEKLRDGVKKITGELPSVEDTVFPESGPDAYTRILNCIKGK